MAATKLKVGCAGLGRMGERHALHFMNLIGRAGLVAVSTPAEVEVQWAKEFQEPYGVTIYTDCDEMLRHPGLQAVIIASVTTVHAEQSIKAIEIDKHVLCEKPLSTSIEIASSQSVVHAAMHNLVTIHEPTKIRREIPGDYFGRYEQAFIHEAEEFTA